MFKTILLTAALAAVLLTNVSWGHAKLIESAPAEGATVSEATKTLSLSFNEEVKLAALKLTLAGKPVPVSLDKSAPSTKTVVVPISPLAPGAYELHWTAISTDDGHVTRGSFTFTVVGP